jgi:murein L,D-transpeptidase YcbB/YkuD
MLRSSNASSATTPETSLSNRVARQCEPHSACLFLNRPANTAAAYALLLIFCLFASGCHSLREALPGMGSKNVDAGAVADRLRTLTSAETLAVLHWANFDDCRQNVQALYEAIHYTPAWVREGQATPQALAVISALEDSQHKGLNAEDYDASQWPARLVALKAGSGNADTVAQFDAALTINAMRYLSNLRTGRLNPKPVGFGIDLNQKHYDLPQFLSQLVLTASNVQEVLNEVEPQYLRIPVHVGT